jgi:hypothetical protein
MAEGKDPLHQLVDLVVFAPIGLLTLAQKELPQLIATGRARINDQVTVARFVGKMAVRKGKKELDRRLGESEKIVQRDVISSPLDRVEPMAPLAQPAETLPEAIIEAVAQSPLLDDADSLPIEGYDSLAASQVVLRLDSLTPDELAAIRSYESANRNRRTILGKIAQLQAR